jgi:outer membrane protein
MNTKMLKTLLALMLICPLGLFAQTKLGHINTNELLSKMPTVTEAKKQLETYGKEFEEQLQTLSKEYEKLVTDYQTNSSKWSDVKRKDMEAQIVSLQQRVQAIQQDAKESVEKKQEELLQPIITKVKDAIKAVAKEGKYNYIFDTGVGVLLYAEESEDITPQVKKKLGLQ